MGNSNPKRWDPEHPSRQISLNHWLRRHAKRYSQKDLTNALKDWKTMLDNMKEAIYPGHYYTRFNIYGPKQISKLKKTWPTKEWLARRRTRVGYIFMFSKLPEQLVRCTEWLGKKTAKKHRRFAAEIEGRGL